MRGIVSALCLIFMSIGAHAATIDWSTRSVPTGSAALFAPDNIGDTVSGTKYYFDGPAIDYPSFQSALGLTDAQMARADLVLFDLNGGGSPAGGIESTQILIGDGVTATTVSWDETLTTIAPEAVAWGTFAPGVYGALFGITPAPTDKIGFLILDVPATIAVSASTFEVALVAGALAGLPGEGTPDFDALGRISNVVEPSSIALLGLCLASMIGCRRVLR